MNVEVAEMLGEKKTCPKVNHHLNDRDSMVDRSTKRRSPTWGSNPQP